MGNRKKNRERKKEEKMIDDSLEWMLNRKRPGVIITQWNEWVFLKEFYGALPIAKGRKVYIVGDEDVFAVAEMETEEEAQKLEKELRVYQILETDPDLPSLDVREMIKRVREES